MRSTTSTWPCATPRRSDAERPSELLKGIRLVQEELVSALGRVGVESFSPEGEPFDPVEQEAMAQQPVESAEPGTVVEVYQRATG